MGGGRDNLCGIGSQSTKEPESMVTTSLAPDDQPDKVENQYSATPSVSTTGNQNTEEEVKNKDDILVRVEGVSSVADLECAVVKKRLWCKTHECVIKCQSVTSKKWQYSEKNMKYMYVSKCVKKYVCPSYKVNQVQLRVEKTDDMRPTKIESEVFGSVDSIPNNDDIYSGAVGGEVR